MTKRFFGLAICCVLTLQIPAALRAGGFLEQLDITGLIASPIPGNITARIVPIRWDTRSIPVQYSMNTSLDRIPNPLGTAFLRVADATTAMQASFDAWNELPSSYIDMRITGTTKKTTLSGFDFVNELTFRTASNFGAIAASPSTSLLIDITLEHGQDLDGDGDRDVDASISVTTDVDRDGDLEFPAGFYKAGTIFDNDVFFNTKTSNGFRFTVDPAAIDTVTRSVDLMAVAVHEFGHSLGLAHSMDNQASAADGNGATMFPFLDTGEPESERAQATLGTDDIAWASYHYPEGSQLSGPAALQTGDIAFDAAYGVISGELRHGVLNQPIAGGSVYAVNRETNIVVASGYSGTTQLVFNPATGGTLMINDPAFHILDGNYVIPVPKGNYRVGAEPIDGRPVAAANISVAAQIGALFGQMNFNEEFYNDHNEDVLEVRPGQGKNVHVNEGRTRAGIDITTNRTVNINNFGNANFVGFNVPAGSIYAVRIPASQIQAVIDSAAAAGKQIGFHSIAYDTAVLNASVAPIFAEATLTTGSISADGATATPNLAEPLQRVTGFLGADSDFAPFFFESGHELGRIVAEGIANGSIQNLFLVLRIPTTTPFPGVSNMPPLIGLDGGVPTNDVPIFGLSYLSTNGGATFNRNNTFNFRFSLVLSEMP